MPMCPRRIGKSVGFHLRCDPPTHPARMSQSPVAAACAKFPIAGAFLAVAFEQAPQPYRIVE